MCNKYIIAINMLLATIMIILLPITGHGEILTPSTSCQISKGIYQENVTHLTTVISLINEFGSDKPTFLFKEAKAKKEFVERMEALFDSYGVTLQDHTWPLQMTTGPR